MPYKDKKTKRADKEDWVVFDDTQEPIVDEETWLLAPKLRQDVYKRQAHSARISIMFIREERRKRRNDGKGNDFIIDRWIAEATECDFKVALEVKKPKSWLKSVSAFANGDVYKRQLAGLRDRNTYGAFAGFQLLVAFTTAGTFFLQKLLPFDFCLLYTSRCV